MKVRIISLFAVALLVGCTDQSSTTPQPNDPPSTETETEPEIEEPQEMGPDLHTYFMPNQSIARFEGMGNEYATYTLETQYLYDDYIGTLEDNGGTVVQRIYRVEENRIVKIFEEVEAYEADFPPFNELESMPELETYLSLPLEEGTAFGGWTIEQVDGTLETPFQTFTDVIMLSQEGEDQSVIEKYFVEGFGEVKRVFRMPGGEGEEFEVISTLQSVD
ncbi:hypothetical protein JOD03_000514 [Chryseomicrobium aureum]|uniref:hypothetical protein n=1 Tax=Chryseomicrobium aureum TaxID=1441723 RepID=UPI0019587067|nr:hypothetical protein [Chryseomicrobium aureum]MBM7705631.1 hypothetical protein [Chryseomicrobium aureum]